MASIVDKPKESTQQDLLDMQKYTNGLIQFINSSSTPITIGIQGEWGSGKTSLLNTIKDELCEKNDAKHFGIWINTWEYSLLSTPDETLIKIISGLITNIKNLTLEGNQSDFGKRAVAKIGSLLESMGGTVGGFTGVGIQATGVAIKSTVEEDYTANEINTINALRRELQNIINESIKQNNKKSFIFFIDDLDRLEPSTAVSILELIKNLFDLHNCIFILAIDYGVVIKGLQSKFGKMTEENEWEFRAFFDKIIQLPFSMPVSNYNVSNYIKELLISVQYFNNEDLENNEYIYKISEVVKLTVGTNPRSLKRLANSVALIENIRGEESITVDNKIIEFSLICLQISYPLIYNFIQIEPNYLEWDQQFVMNILKNKNIDTNELEQLKESEEFDEEWEQNLWKICQINSFLKQKAYYVSKLLNFIKDSISYKTNEEFTEILNNLLNMSSVTSISTPIQQKTRVRKAVYMILDGHKTEAKNSAKMVFEILKYLVDNELVKNIQIPWGRSNKRYILTNDKTPMHPNGKEFSNPVTYNGYTIEAHYSRKQQIKNMMNLCSDIGIELKIEEDF